MRKVPKKSYLWVKWWWQVLRLECWSLFLRFWVGAPLPPHCHWWNVCQFNSKKSYQVSAGHVAQMELLRPSQICLGSFNRVEVPQSSKLVDIGEEASSGQMGEISSHLVQYTSFKRSLMRPIFAPPPSLATIWSFNRFHRPRTAVCWLSQIACV